MPRTLPAVIAQRKLGLIRDPARCYSETCHGACGRRPIGGAIRGKSFPIDIDKRRAAAKVARNSRRRNHG